MSGCHYNYGDESAVSFSSSSAFSEALFITFNATKEFEKHNNNKAMHRC